jgi:hypothetical protein
MKHEEYCPITLEQNKRWFESISPYCTCNKTLQKNIRPEIPQCIAPTHTWEPLLVNSDTYRWVCKNCRIKIN